jgi:hypothetical protein
VNEPREVSKVAVGFAIGKAYHIAVARSGDAAREWTPRQLAPSIASAIIATSFWASALSMLALMNSCSGS